MAREVPEEARRLNDVAFSGNGEPTTSPQFAEAVELVERLLGDVGLLGEIRVVLITNGSRLHRPDVQRGIERMARFGGEVWFKLDSATREGRRRLNDIEVPDARVENNLRTAARLCRTRIQTCVVALDGEAWGPPSSPPTSSSWIDYGETAWRSQTS